MFAKHTRPAYTQRWNARAARLWLESNRFSEPGGRRV